MKINISIDDVSPHEYSGIDVISQCNKILSVFPDAKFTLFIPAAYWRTIPRPSHVATEKPLRLSKFPEFCSQLMSLPTENFELGVHGYYHGIPGKTNNDEFRSLNYVEAMNKFGDISHEIQLAGLSNAFKPIFRPPAWRMNPNSINAARDSGYKVLALSPNPYALKEYSSASMHDVVFYDAAPRDEPIEILQSLPPRDFMPLKEGKELKVVYHACEWDKNYLSDNLVGQLIEFLSNLTCNLDFVFMEGLSRGNYGKI